MPTRASSTVYGGDDSKPRVRVVLPPVTTESDGHPTTSRTSVFRLPVHLKAAQVKPQIRPLEIAIGASTGGGSNVSEMVKTAAAVSRSARNSRTTGRSLSLTADNYASLGDGNGSGILTGGVSGTADGHEGGAGDGGDGGYGDNDDNWDDRDDTEDVDDGNSNSNSNSNNHDKGHPPFRRSRNTRQARRPGLTNRYRAAIYPRYEAAMRFYGTFQARNGRHAARSSSSGRANSTLAATKSVAGVIGRDGKIGKVGQHRRSGLVSGRPRRAEDAQKTTHIVSASATASAYGQAPVTDCLPTTTVPVPAPAIWHALCALPGLSLSGVERGWLVRAGLGLGGVDGGEAELGIDDYGDALDDTLARLGYLLALPAIEKTCGRHVEKTRLPSLLVHFLAAAKTVGAACGNDDGVRDASGMSKPSATMQESLRETFAKRVGLADTNAKAEMAVCLLRNTVLPMLAAARKAVARDTTAPKGHGLFHEADVDMESAEAINAVEGDVDMDMDDSVDTCDGANGNVRTKHSRQQRMALAALDAYLRDEAGRTDVR